MRIQAFNLAQLLEHFNKKKLNSFNYNPWNNLGMAQIWAWTGEHVYKSPQSGP